MRVAGHAGSTAATFRSKSGHAPCSAQTGNGGYMLKRAAVLGGVLLALSLTSAGWDPAPRPVDYLYDSDPGSAVCAGLATNPAGETRHYVWNMIAYYNYGQFFAYDIDQHAQVYLHQTPLPAGKGGALAYVPEYWACPPNGWVFAFRGKEITGEAGTRDFWVYYPSRDKWYQAEGDQRVPEEVKEGGSLCFGGVQALHGRSYAVLYAFTGQEDFVSPDWRGHFWRYTFQVVPFDEDGPLLGQWEQMRSVRRDVTKGTALAWLPLCPAVSAKGTVVAILGPLHDSVWTWEASEDTPGPDWVSRVPTAPYSVEGGASMAPLANGHQVVFTYGGGTRDFHRWDAAYPSQPPVPRQNTPEDVEYGAGLCRLGDTCYLDIGTQPNIPTYMFGYFVNDPGDGGQTAGLGDLASLRVRISAAPGSHRFDASGVTGPVRLVVTDAAGRLLKSAHSESHAGSASLTWTHPGLPAGVYFYRVSADGQSVGGKVTVLR
jgi:hypothetical protein